MYTKSIRGEIAIWQKQNNSTYVDYRKQRRRSSLCMKKMQIIISIVLLSIVLSIPAYAGTKNGKKDEIYVRIPVNSDIFEPDEVFYLRVNKGDRVSLTKSTITYIDKKGNELHKCPNGHIAKWKSSNPQIVSVSRKGVIRAKKAGKAVITLKCGKNVCKLNVCVDSNSPKFLRKGKQLEKRIDALYKKYGKKGRVNDRTLEKAIVETSKLKSDCIYYGYEYCDMKGLEVGITELERRPKTTGYTYASLSYMLDDIETEWGGTIWGYTLIHNADKLDKVASIIHDYLMGKNPYDVVNSDHFEIQGVDVQKEYAKITLKEPVTKDQVLGGLLFNGYYRYREYALEDGCSAYWAYLLPQKTPTAQKIPFDFCVTSYETEEELVNREFWKNKGEKDYIYMEGYYGLNESVIECKPTACKSVNGKMKKPLAPGKYVASIQPGPHLGGMYTMEYKILHSEPKSEIDHSQWSTKVCILYKFEVK